MIRSHCLKKKGSRPGTKGAKPFQAPSPEPRARSLAPGAAGLSSHAGLRAVPPCPHLTVGCAAPRAASSARKRQQATPHGTCRRARRRPRSPPIAAGGWAIHSRTTERSGTRPNGGDRRAQNVSQIKCVDQLIKRRAAEWQRASCPSINQWLSKRVVFRCPGTSAFIFRVRPESRRSFGMQSYMGRPSRREGARAGARHGRRGLS